MNIVPAGIKLRKLVLQRHNTVKLLNIKFKKFLLVVKKIIAIMDAKRTIQLGCSCFSS